MSADLEFAALARRLVRGLSRIEREQICCGDVTLQQFETLRLIHGADALTTGALAIRLGIDLSTASRNLAVLERSGYVARRRSRDDARQITTHLTRKGTRCIDSLSCDEQSIFAAVLSRVPRARRPDVMDALRVLADAVETSHEASTPGCCAPTVPPGAQEDHR